MMKRTAVPYPRPPFPGAASAVIAMLFLFVAGCAVVPQPFTADAMKMQAREERTKLFADQEPLTGKVSLYEAMGRAVKYNLDHQVKRIEEALAQGNLDKARYDLLPQLVASVRASERNNDNGSSSQSLLTGSQSLEVSTSQEKQQFSADIIHVWNVLDFGVGYTQALQMADEVLISEEWRRKAVQNIVQDIRYAYWRAVSAQQLLPEMDLLLQRVEDALARSRQMEETRAQDPVKTLAYQQELLETVRQLWSMRRELSLAKTELASLMNMAPWVDFELETNAAPAHEATRILAIEALEEFALESRPEIRVESYNKRIGANEVKKALLSMLPGLEINLNANYDSNDFLYNSTWLQAGLSVSWNAFNLLAGPKAIKAAEIQQDLAGKRSLATAMMVLTQVHLAHQGYALALKEHDITKQLEDVLARRLWHAAAAKKALAGSEQEEIRNQAAALSAKMNRGLAFAELQGAFGRVLSSAGIDPLPAAVPEDDLPSLSRLIEEQEGLLLAALRQEVLQGEDETPAEAPVKVEEIPAALVEPGMEVVPATSDLPKKEMPSQGMEDTQEGAASPPELTQENSPAAPAEREKDAPQESAPEESAVGKIPDQDEAQHGEAPSPDFPASEEKSALPEAAPAGAPVANAAEVEAKPAAGLLQEEEKGEASQDGAEISPVPPPALPEEGKKFSLKMKSSTLPYGGAYRSLDR